MKKTIFSALIAVLVLTLLLASCKDTTPQTKTIETSPTGTVSTVPLTTAEPEEKPDIPEGIRFDGETFRVLIYQATGASATDTFDFFVEPREGEIIYEAARERERTIEEKYGIEIEVTITNTNKVETLAMASVSAGLDQYEVITPMIERIYPMIEKNALVELHTVDNLNLEKTYWDQQIQEDLSIDGKLYTITGDISVCDEELNICIAFNKDFAARYDINPYKEIENNNWTIDTMYTLAKNGTHDLNSDGKLDINDEYGWAHSTTSAFELFQGSGERYAKLNDDGKPEITINNARAIECIQKLTDIYNDSSVVGTLQKNLGTWATLNQMMVDGKIMFRPANIYNLRQYLLMEDECGAIPMPKLDADQERYYHLVLTNACAGYSVPVTNSKLEMTGIILEELAYYGRKILTPAYYDSYVKTRLTPDLDTRAMFDIIFESKIYDVGYVFKWGNFTTIIGNVVTNNGGVASALDAAMSSAETAMNATYDKLHSAWG